MKFLAASTLAICASLSRLLSRRTPAAATRFLSLPRKSEPLAPCRPKSTAMAVGGAGRVAKRAGEPCRVAGGDGGVGGAQQALPGRLAFSFPFAFDYLRRVVAFALIAFEFLFFAGFGLLFILFGRGRGQRVGRGQDLARRGRVSAWADRARPRIAIRARVATKDAHQATLAACASGRARPGLRRMVP